MNAKILEASKDAALAIYAAYKRDRANKYTLPQECKFDILVRTPSYDGEFWRFDPQPDAPDGTPRTTVTLKAYGEKSASGETVCDGASFAPDTPTGVLPAAALHDPGYLEMASIAAAWKDEPFDPGKNFRRDRLARRGANGSTTWSEADVRLLFDTIFGDAMRKSGACGFIVRLYYSAVRFFGGWFTSIFGANSRLVILAALISSLSAGCTDPFDIIDGDTFSPPDPVFVGQISHPMEAMG